jgi:hypothetical protein
MIYGDLADFRRTGEAGEYLIAGRARCQDEYELNQG